MRRLIAVVGLGVLGAAVATAIAARDHQPRGIPRRIVVRCDAAIDQTETPPVPPYKVLFGRIAVPTDDRVLQTVYDRHVRPFHYVAKQGFVIRAGRGPVDVRASPTWHDRMTISGASAVRYIGCRSVPELPWLAYANLFTVKRPACVSIVVTLGGESTRIRVPLGRPC